MKRKSVFTLLSLLTVVYGLFYIYQYYNDHFVSQRIIDNILKREHYNITNKGKVIIDILIKPEWLPLETEKPLVLGVKVAESNNTDIVLRQVWNRGNDIYFSFYTTYKLNYSDGEFLYNMIINNDGSYTSVGSHEDLKLVSLSGDQINVGQTGYGPGSGFSFGVGTTEYEKIKDGFTVSYSGMLLYEYSRK